MKTQISFVALLCLSACATPPRRFALADPIWVDYDNNHVVEEPDEYYSGLMGDGSDQMFFRPLSRVWTFPLEREAMNVNAIDEVPNSSWFHNRIGVHDIPPEIAAQGACSEKAPGLNPDQGPWMVTGAKPNGANPGFFVTAPDGSRYLLKFDGPKQPTRATGSDVMGSKIYWNAGYHTPCNFVVYFPENVLQIDPKAKAENEFGEKEPIQKEDIDKVLLKAFRLKDGRLRASASAFVNGKPLGPFSYEGTRSDDPNDVVPHQHRRELRGSYIFAAWINHFDSREQNSLNVWWKEGERQYIKHFIIDWGDSLGSRWPLDQISRRLGRSYYLDFEHVFFDLITFGLIPRDWNEAERAEQEIFGYFDVDHFDPEDYRPGYPNPAFEERTPSDIMWAVRILARFTPEHITAIAKEAKFPDPRQEEFIIKRLIERQRKIIETFATKYAPLTNFQLARRTLGSNAQSLCFEDIAVQHGVVDPKLVIYKMRMYGGEQLDQEIGWLQFSPDADHPHRACVLLPIGHTRPADLVQPIAPDHDPMRYGIMKIFIHQTQSVQPTSEVDLHFYDLGPDKGFRLVGITRPNSPVKPTQF
jgi:hypothetical protein